MAMDESDAQIVLDLMLQESLPDLVNREPETSASLNSLADSMT